MIYYPLTGGEAIVFVIVCILFFRWIYKEDKKPKEKRIQEAAQEQERNFAATETADNSESEVNFSIAKFFVVGAIVVLLFYLSFIFPSLINVVAGIVAYYSIKFLL